MDDLISRKALLEEIRSYQYDTCTPDMRRAEHIVKAHFTELIDKQPTAFDLESVIRKLEEKIIEEAGIDKSRLSMDREEYSSYCLLTLADVIEILNSSANAANGKIGG